MPARRTEITELATALGMLEHGSVSEAMAGRPPELLNVDDATWADLAEAFRGGRHAIDFEGAWANGWAFRRSTEGLRDRPPLRIEWKGPHRAPAYEFLPADLRVDHVFLVSCKHDSHILANTSPAHLFDDLQWGRIESDRSDWYEEVASAEYQAFYDAVRKEMAGERHLPELVGALTRDDRQAIKTAFPRVWPRSLQGPYEDFAAAVSRESASRWRRAMASQVRRELAFWRLMRMGAAPYFLLGESGGERLRIRVATPWDWRQRFALSEFAVSASRAAQPRVDWEARVHDREADADRSVLGFVEVRWSHGRFSAAPEAKVQLTTPHSEVPGYFPLA